MKLAGFRLLLFIAFVPLMALCNPRSALAQPALLSPPQLDQVVARIALYPDPLLAQILTASTYWTEIPGSRGMGRSTQLSERGCAGSGHAGGPLAVGPEHPGLVALPFGSGHDGTGPGLDGATR